jgi:hypothetical protein
MGKRIDLRWKGFRTWHATASFRGKAGIGEHSCVDHNDVMDMTAERIAVGMPAPVRELSMGCLFICNRSGGCKTARALSN